MYYLVVRISDYIAWCKRRARDTTPWKPRLAILVLAAVFLISAITNVVWLAVVAAVVFAPVQILLFFIEAHHRDAQQEKLAQHKRLYDVKRLLGKHKL